MELAEAIKAVGSGKSLLDNRAAEVLMSRLRRDTEQDERLWTCRRPNAPCCSCCRARD